MSGAPEENATHVAVGAAERKDGVVRTNIEIEETTEDRLERLGRMRPEKFKSLWAEIGFCFSIVMSQVLTVRIKPNSQRFVLLILQRNTSSLVSTSSYRRSPPNSTFHKPRQHGPQTPSRWWFPAFYLCLVV